MNVLVLTKRQYMGKDLLDERFGRFRELPLELAALGHSVTGIALSYRARTEGLIHDRASTENGVTWHSINACNGVWPRLDRYARRVFDVADKLKPDILWAGSDAYHAIFGCWLAKRKG